MRGFLIHDTSTLRHRHRANRATAAGDARSHRFIRDKPSAAQPSAHARLEGEPSTHVGPADPTTDAIVALGKFDALHLGHRALAVRAAQMGGLPFLLSFSGMAEVLGWPFRQPLVAACDRARVLKSWEAACLGRCPRQRYVPFHEIRTMSPEEFVRVLAMDLQAVGVVAGSNYRFGYKAAGDADALRELGAKYGLKVSIVDLLQENDGSRRHLHAQAVAREQEERVQESMSAEAGAQSRPPPVPLAFESNDDLVPHCISSTKARELLLLGDVKGVAALLGRQYRLVASLDPATAQQQLDRHCSPGGGDANMSSTRQSNNGSSQALPTTTPAGTGAASHAAMGSQLHPQHHPFVLPAHTFLNETPAPGVYEASLVVVAREEDSALGSRVGGGGNGGGLLPLDLESGAGLPVRVDIGPEGLRVAQEALGVAMAAARPCHVGGSGSSSGAGVGVQKNESRSGQQQQWDVPLYVVLDFSDLVEVGW